MSEDLMELVDDCPISEASVLGAKGEEVISEYRKLGFTKATEETYQKNLDVSKRQRIYEFEYRVITTEAIRKFLQRKVKLYDKEHKPKPKKKNSIYELAEMAAEMARQEYLELAREELRRSVVIPEPSIGILENMRSAQEQLNIHRQQGIMEAQQRRQREAQIHQIIAYDPIPFHAPWSNPSGTCSIYEKTCDYNKLDPETIGRFEWNEERVEDYDGLPPVEVLETFKEHKARGAFDYFTIASVNSIPDPLLLGRIDGDDDNRWFIDNWGTDVCLDDLI